MEIWKDIPGYEGHYQVSDKGRVKSLKFNKKKILSPGNKQGYLVVTLLLNGKRETIQVHQLVAIAFLNHTRCGHKKVVNHKNFNPSDNRLENLEVVTNRENTNKKHIKDTSDYIGVHWRKDVGKWRSQITYNNKLIRLGLFDSEKEASDYYQNALIAINNGQEIKVKKLKRGRKPRSAPQTLGVL